MSWLGRYLGSSLGMKQIMALTGLLLAGFAAFHMLSHLQVFVSRDAYNSYAHQMQSLGGLLWVARGGLLFIVLIHVGTALRLVAMNRAARPVRYKRFRPIKSRFYSRAMALTGLALVVFIVFHILHFTTGDVMKQAYDQVDRWGRHDVYKMMVLGFQNKGMAIGYIAAMALLCMHLAHGMTSWFQSLGLNHPKYNGFIRWFGPSFGIIVFAGYLAVPVAVLAGSLKP